MAATPLTRICAAVIVAAGSSRRMGFDKLAAPLAGRPVLLKTLEAFLAATSIAEVVIVCSIERWQDIDPSLFSKPVRRVDGGINRQDSVMAGLAAVSTAAELVAIHDGARPLISPQAINRCVAAATEHGAAALARRVTETVKRADSENFNATAVCREQLWLMETPQVFEIPLLRQAYAAVSAQNLAVTDEVSAMEVLGIRVKFVESEHPNLKITTPADLLLAAALLR